MPVTVPGRVYSNLVEDGPARRALAEQAARDWRSFLSERAHELVDRGELVLTAGASQPDGASGAEGLFTMVEAQLDAMVDDAILRPGESDRIFYPTWNRTPDEWRAPVDALGFDLLADELGGTDDAESYRPSLQRGSFADDYLPFVRAITEKPFFRWLDPDRGADERARIVEAFSAGLRAHIAAAPQGAACHWHVMTLRLRRRPR